TSQPPCSRGATSPLSTIAQSPRRRSGRRILADVLRARPDDRVLLVLLDRVADPADCAADREQRERGAVGQAERAHDRDQREGYVRRCAEDVVRGRDEIARVFRAFGLRQAREQHRGARVAVGIKRVAEALYRLAATQTFGETAAQPRAAPQ